MSNGSVSGARSPAPPWALLLPAAPDAPTGLSAAARTRSLQVDLGWDAPARQGASAVTHYTVFRSTAVAGPFEPVATPAGTSFTDTLPDSGQYHYQVSASNGQGESPATGTETASVALKAPVNLVALASAGLAPRRRAMANSLPCSSVASSHEI